MNKRFDKGLSVAVVALLLAQFYACAHRPPAGEMLLVKGELTQGAECLMIVEKSGTRYSLTGNPGRFKIGDRVCVRGRVASASICMAGEATLSIQGIGPEDACP